MSATKSVLDISSFCYLTTSSNKLGSVIVICLSSLKFGLGPGFLRGFENKNLQISGLHNNEHDVKYFQ